MTKSDKGAKHQAKHYQPEDHAHAAHQERAAPGHAKQPARAGADEAGKGQSAQRGNRADPTPKGPRRGQ